MLATNIEVQVKFMGPVSVTGHKTLAGILSSNKTLKEHSGRHPLETFRFIMKILRNRWLSHRWIWIQLKLFFFLGQ